MLSKQNFQKEEHALTIKHLIRNPECIKDATISLLQKMRVKTKICIGNNHLNTDEIKMSQGVVQEP